VTPDAAFPGSWAHLTAPVALVGGPYFEANGITDTLATGVDTVKGKGWSFTMTFGAAAAAPVVGSTATPTYTACLVP
jgi:hypothetical protein